MVDIRTGSSQYLNGNDKTATSTNIATTSLALSVDVDDMIVAVFAFDNISTGTPTLNSVSASLNSGTTISAWTIVNVAQISGTAAAASKGAYAYARVTAVPAGPLSGQVSTITGTLSAGVLARAVACCVIDDLDWSNINFGTPSVAAGNLATSLQLNTYRAQLALNWSEQASIISTTTSATARTGIAFGSWTTGSGGATNVSCSYRLYHADDNTGTPTANVTFGTTDGGLALINFQDAPASVISKSASDTGTLSATEGSTVVPFNALATPTASDTSTFSATETSNIVASTTTPVASDTGSISGYENSHISKDGFTTKVFETFNAMPSDIVVLNATIETGGASGDNALLTTGGGKMWYSNGGRWSVTTGDYRFTTILKFGSGGREIYNIMFGMRSGTTDTNCDGFAWRMDSADPSITALKITGGSHAVPSATPGSVIYPTDVWLKAVLGISGTVATLNVTRIDTGASVFSNSYDFASSIDANHSMYGNVGQWKDGAGNINGILVDSVAIDYDAAGGPVAKSGTDTGTFSATEARTIASTSTSTDTGTLSATEARTIVSTSTSTDTGTISATEARTVSITSTTSDTGSLSATETASVSIALSSTDTGAISASDTSQSALTSASTDTGALSATDTSSSFSVVGMPTIYDDFNRGTLGANWNVVSGSATITANQMEFTGGTNNIVQHTTPIPTNDHFVEVTASGATTAGTSAILRGVDGNTFYLGRFDSTTGNWEIWKRIAGTMTLLGSTAGSVGASWKMRFEAVGNSLSLYADNALRVSVTDSSIPTGYLVGLRANVSGCYADDFYAGPVIPASVDSGTISAVESSAIAVAIARTDTGAFSATETATVAVTLSATDTGTLSATDTSALFKTITATDSGTFSATETATVFNDRPGTDTGTLSATETADIVVTGTITKSATDTGTLSATDTSSSALSTTSTDAGTFSATDTSASAISVTTTDTGTFSATETRTIASTSASTDTGTLSATETAAVVISLTLSANDSGTLSAADSSSVIVSGIVSVNASDTGTFSVTESVATQAQFSSTDTGSVSASDASALFKAITASDSGSISATDLSALFKTITASDSGTLSGTETANVFNDRPGTDTGTISATETSSVVVTGTVTVSANDTGTLSASETRATAVGLNATDTGTLSATDSSLLFKTITANDAGTVSATESAVVFKVLTSSDFGTLSAVEVALAEDAAIIHANYWNGTTMVPVTLRVWNGTALVAPTMWRWNGTSFDAV